MARRKRKRSNPRPDPPAAQRGGRARAPGRRRLRFLGALLGLAAIGTVAVVAWRHGSGTAPTIEVPANLAQFDPQVRAYIEHEVQKAREAPELAESHARLGLIYAAHKLWPEARVCFENAAGLDPSEPLAGYHEALTAIQVGDFDAAVDLLRQVVRQHPDCAPAHHRLGVLLMDRNDIPEAKAEFENVIELLPRGPAGYAGMGEAQLRAGEFPAAIAMLERALQYDPSDRMIHYLLGTAYLRNGRQAEAEAHLYQGLDATRRYIVDAWSRERWMHAMTPADQLARALQLSESGRGKEGAEILETALTWHPRNVDIMNNLAIIYLGLGEYRRAHDMLLRAVEVDPRRFQTFVNLAAVRRALPDLEGALEAITTALSLAPQAAQAHLTHAHVLEDLRRPAEALEAYLEALRFDTENLTIRAGLADLLYRFGRLNEAEEQFAILVQKDPSRFAAHVRLCDIYLRLGNFKAASKSYEAARNLDPNHPDIALLARLIEERSRP